MRLCITGQGRPARGCAVIDRGRAQIVGQSRAQSLFISGLDPQKIKNLPALGSIALHELGERRDFCAKRVGLTLRFAADRAGVGLSGLRLRAGIVRCDKRCFG